MRDYRFHCEDCDSYSQCQYYHNRKGTSLICKEFQYGSSVIEQIRDEIKAEMDDIASGCVARYSHDEGYYSGLCIALNIIDKYREGQTE